jgi:hypothetical protein
MAIAAKILLEAFQQSSGIKSISLLAPGQLIFQLSRDDHEVHCSNFG